MRVELQPGYLLHSRPYRDSSLIIDCLTPGFGRISLVAKGVRSSSRQLRGRRSLLQPFVPVLLGWTGNTDLKTLTAIEASGPSLRLQGLCLFAALYSNEILMRLVPRYDEQPVLFSHYHALLQALQSGTGLEPALRRFELQLLEQLGYGLTLTVTADSQQPVQAGCEYRFDPEQAGVYLADPSAPVQRRFRGEELLAIASGRFEEGTLAPAKRLCRLALQVHLGDKPLKSRELFIK